MNKTVKSLLTLVIAVAFFGCASKNNPVGPDTTENPTFQSTNIKDGAVYFSFDKKDAVPVWDLKFGTYGQYGSPDFYLNDALFANSRVEIQSTGATDFASITTVDKTAFGVDPDTTICGGNWYDYNPTTHTISSKGIVYLLKTANDTYVKFKIDGYQTNVFTVSYAVFDETAAQFKAAQTKTVDKSAGEVKFSFANGAVTPADWDLKLAIVPTFVPEAGFTLSFPALLLNRAANVTAKAVPDQEFEKINAASITGLTTDADSTYVIGSDWFDYDSNSHLVTSKKIAYVLKTVSGKMVKFRIINYYNDQGVSGYLTLEYVE